MLATLVCCALLVASSVSAQVTNQAYLKASNAQANDIFGSSVAVSGDTLVVGAQFETSNATGVNGDQTDNSASNTGAAYVFVRSGGSWVQQAYLKASNSQGNDTFGAAVAISGNTIAIAATLEDSAATGVNGDQSDNSAVFSGAVYVFVRNGSTWHQQAYLKPSNTQAGEQFGHSLALDGNTIVVGSALEDSAALGVNGDDQNDDRYNSGAAYVFVRIGGTWSQQAYLKAPNAGEQDSFGRSVSVSGDTVVVGADWEDSSATGVDGDPTDNSAVRAGAAYVFVRDGSTWTYQAYIKASNTGSTDHFGIAVAVSGDTLVVGANYEDSRSVGVNGDQQNNLAINAGAAYVYTRSGTTWSQQAFLKASNTQLGDMFGLTVALSGDVVLVGALEEDSASPGIDGDQADDSAPMAGAVYVFGRTGATWSQLAYLKASSVGIADEYSHSLAVSGETAVVGARFEDSDSTGVDGDDVNNNANSAGAAWVYDVPQDPWVDLGGGSPGVAGTPLLMGDGSLVAFTTATLQLTQVVPSALLVGWIALAPSRFPAAGGVVHVFPFVTQQLFTADPTGAFTGSTTWPPGVPPGTEVWFQFAAADASTSAGFTLSNGLTATTP